MVLYGLDYRSRRGTAYALEGIAADAAGRPVDVRLTDIPEWAAQNRCAASFTAAIRSDLTPARDGYDRAIRWDTHTASKTRSGQALERSRPATTTTRRRDWIRRATR